MIQALQVEGIDLIELSGGTYEAPAMSDQQRHSASTLQREAYFLEFAEKTRSLAIEPDLPKRLLAGQEPRHRVQTIRTGIGAVDRMALMEVVWYSRQLRRMARERPTKPDESGLWAFIANLFSNAIDTWKTRRLRA